MLNTYYVSGPSLRTLILLHYSVVQVHEVVTVITPKVINRPWFCRETHFQTPAVPQSHVTALHVLKKYSWRTYYVPSPIHGAEATEVNEAESQPEGAFSLVRGQTDKQVIRAQ